jgi:hypothetical protein
MNDGSQKFHVTNIMWDIDPEDEHASSFLPGAMHVEVHSDSVTPGDDDALAELIGDLISEETGYCHYGFNYAPVEPS